MPFPTLLFPERLDADTRATLEDLVTQLQNYLSIQHDANGAHTDITAQQLIAVPGASEGLMNAVKLGRQDIAGGQGAWAGCAPYAATPSDPYGVLLSNSGAIILQWNAATGVTINNGFIVSTDAFANNFVAVAGSFHGGIGLTTFSLSATGLTLVNKTVIDNTPKFFERGRATALGEYAGVTFNAGNFTSISGAWTVVIGNQVRYAYRLVGQEMRVAFDIINANVTGTPSELWLAIPASKVAASRAVGLYSAVDAGGTPVAGQVRVETSDTVIRFQPNLAGSNWTATAGNNTAVIGQFSFEIQ